MSLKVITKPSHWSNADIRDIERELIGLIAPDSYVEIVAVRSMKYRPAKQAHADWQTLSESTVLRRSKLALEVKFYIQAPVSK